MSAQPSPKTIYGFAMLHIILPVLGWLVGVIFYNQSFGLSSAFTDFVVSIPLFKSTYSDMGATYGSAAANRMVYLTFYWMLSLIPLVIAYFLLGIWSALRISSGKQEFKPGKLIVVVIGCAVWFFYGLFSVHSYSSETRLERVVLNTDFKFVFYTSVAVPGLWLMLAAIQPIALLTIKFSNIIFGNKIGASHDR